MNKKLLAYAFVPVLGLGLLGAGTASAHGMFGGFGSATPEEIAGLHTAQFESHAKILGISVDEVKNAWADGQGLRELAQSKGLSQEEIQKRLQAAREEQHKSQLKTLVDKGIITQAQADKRIATMKNKQPNGQIKGRQGRRGPGIGRGMRMGGPGMGQQGNLQGQPGGYGQQLPFQQ